MKSWLASTLACSVTLFSAAAHAEESRSISLGDSASPDAPVTGLAWSSRARASLGGDLTLLHWSRARIGIRALLGVEDAEKFRPFPQNLGRSAIELGVALPLEALGPQRKLELGFGLGNESAFSLQGFVLRDRYHSDDVPFGAGGWYLGSDLAFHAPLSAHWSVTTRVALHLYTNLFPDLVGAHEASDVLADQLREGAELKTLFEVGVRCALTPGYQPLARVHVDAIQPHDDSAHPLWLGRLLIALAMPRNGLEIQPFVDTEAGHGHGLLVNRNQLRVGGGVRLHAE